MDEQGSDIDALLDAMNSHIGHIKRKWGYNPLDNYKYREILDTIALMRYDPSVKREKSSGRLKYDLITSLGSRGEHKSATVEISVINGKIKVSSCAWAFDKQFDKEEMKESINYSAYVFAAWKDDGKRAIFLIYIDTESGARKINKMLQDKRHEFLAAHAKRKIKKKKRGWDSIELDPEEVICTLTSGLCFNEDYVVLDGYGNRIHSFQKFYSKVWFFNKRMKQKANLSVL